jgi:hypothetical protein
MCSLRKLGFLSLSHGPPLSRESERWGGGGNTFGVQPIQEISLLKNQIIIIIIIIVDFPYAFHTSALLSSRDIQIGK